MTNKKYEFVDGDTITTPSGKTLRRIRALVAIGLSVAAGDLGGYIESEKNLSTSGNAWVYGNAQVYGDARVYGDAQVSDDAGVKKRSDIFWASIVGSENGTLTVMRGKDGLIVARGCFCGSVEKFLEASAKKHDAKIRREYELLIEVAKSRIGVDQ